MVDHEYWVRQDTVRKLENMVDHEYWVRQDSVRKLENMVDCGGYESRLFQEEPFAAGRRKGGVF